MAMNLSELAWDIFKSGAGTAVLAIFAWLWWYASPRREEVKWVCTNGLLFYIYFRNVDWRLNLIRKNFLESSDKVHLLRELTKLKSDIDCLERLTDLWAERVAGFPGWYPYINKVNELLPAVTFLCSSLKRHVEPLLWYYDDPEERLFETRSKEDESDYLDYFRGGIERIWPKKIVPVPKCTASEDLTILREQGRLAKRLGAALEPLLELLKYANVDPENIKQAMIEFGDQGQAQEVWFNPKL